MGWLDKKWNWKRNRVVFLCDHPFLIRKNHWFLDESIKTKLPTMLISCSFLSLISAALVHFPSTRVGPTSLGKVIEKSSTGLCRPLHYSFSTGSEGWQFVWFRSDQISRSVVSDSLQSPWIAARQASLSITNSQSSLRLMSIESVMPSSHLILCRPLLLLPPIPPSIRVFSNESTRLQLFYILCQNVYQPAWMIDFRFFIVGYALH